MSFLVLPLPPRARLGARADPVHGSHGAPAEFDFLFSTDGHTVAHSGCAAPALLPRADHTVVVLADGDVSWHRIEVPKANAARLRAALAGAMEEALLDDAQALHFALDAGAAPGASGWVAVTDSRRLVDVLAALEGAGRDVELVTTASRPRDSARGHFLLRDGDATPTLVLEHRDGVACVGLDGALARSLLTAAGEPVHCTAAPAAAATAEHWLGAPVAALGEAERALGAVRSPFNLRQFDLAPRHRGARALRESWRRLQRPEWRAVRVGLVALAALQVIGLNAYAWQQQRALDGRRQAMDALLRATFPGVRTVLDAPLQMQRETDRARAEAGRPGDAGFEILLGHTAAAWPDGAGPMASLRFDNDHLALATPGWSDAQRRQFAERLQAAGYRAEFTDGRVSVVRAKGGA